MSARAAAPAVTMPALALLTLLLLTALPAHAALNIDTPATAADPQFHRQLKAALAGLARSPDPVLRQLHAAVLASPGRVTIRPLTSERATWGSDGDPDRAHTRPDDGQPKHQGRASPTDATIYLNRDGVEPGRPRYKGGVLVHELQHALDLSAGRYHPDVTVRERRAVFMQNVWRQQIGYRMRDAYRARFPTQDYQTAAARGELDAYVRHLFTRADLPAWAAGY